MPVIAVVNRKGGSGKTTLATHLAGCLANRGLRVMLGDADRQQSAAAWSRRRATHVPTCAAVVGRTVDPKSLKHPTTPSHVANPRIGATKATAEPASTPTATSCPISTAW